jgi:outer membrane lipoprotein-sorting protein
LREGSLSGGKVYWESKSPGGMGQAIVVSDDTGEVILDPQHRCQMYGIKGAQLDGQQSPRIGQDCIVDKKQLQVT